MKVTRKQVAEHASVSEATVSYVINNGPRPVAAETRARVLQAIRELGYHPSDIARSLAKQRTTTIGLILPDTANPFYGEVARVIENLCYARGYTVLLCNSSMDQSRETHYANILHAKRVAGVIILPTHPNTSAIQALQQANIRTIVVDAEIPSATCVVADDFQGGYLLTRHLIQLGHERIASITYTGDVVGYSMRFEGYKAALTEAGLPLDERLIVEAEPEVAAGEAAGLELLRRANRPTAIFAHNDRVALGVLSAARKAGLRTPHDVSVVGFDNLIESAFFSPPLTTINSPKQQMGETAVRLLFEFIETQQEVHIPQTLTLDVTLIVRESTAPPAAL
jgi:LacI family transcriptional regulator